MIMFILWMKHFFCASTLYFMDTFHTKVANTKLFTQKWAGLCSFCCSFGKIAPFLAHTSLYQCERIFFFLNTIPCADWLKWLLKITQLQYDWTALEMALFNIMPKICNQFTSSWCDQFFLGIHYANVPLTEIDEPVLLPKIGRSRTKKNSRRTRTKKFVECWTWAFSHDWH